MNSTSIVYVYLYLKVAKHDSRRWVIKLPLTSRAISFSLPYCDLEKIKRVEKTHNISRYVLLCHIMLHTYCISFAWYIWFHLWIEFLTWHSIFIVQKWTFFTKRPNIFMKTLIFVLLHILQWFNNFFFKFSGKQQ